MVLLRWAKITLNSGNPWTELVKRNPDFTKIWYIKKIWLLFRPTVYLYCKKYTVLKKVTFNFFPISNVTTSNCCRRHQVTQRRWFIKDFMLVFHHTVYAEQSLVLVFCDKSLLLDSQQIENKNRANLCDVCQIKYRQNVSLGVYLSHVFSLPHVGGDDPSVPRAVGFLRTGAGCVAVGVVVRIHAVVLVPPPCRLLLQDRQNRWA